ncbi:phage holin family protein, partial [Proteus mirabilis]
RITAIVISMAETRLRLVATELEEEKSNLIQLILLAGAALLLTAFGLMSLMILVMWAVDPVYRLTAMIIMTSVLLVGALIFALWAVRKARHSSLLGATREQLAIDRQLLERKKQEQEHE